MTNIHEINDLMLKSLKTKIVAIEVFTVVQTSHIEHFSK